MKKTEYSELFGPVAHDPAYTYRAHFVSAYDGDTVTLNIDLGFNIVRHNERIRLFGIDTPEIRGPERKEGVMVRDFVSDVLNVAESLFITTQKDRSGKYGRMLGVLWPQMPKWHHLHKEFDGRSLNQILLDVDMAKPYFGGKRE